MKASTSRDLRESDIKQIRERERRYDLAWNAADPASMGALFTADATVINPFGQVTTERDDIEREIGQLLAGRAKGSTHRSTIERIHFVGTDVAIVDGTAVLEGIRGLSAESATSVEHKFTDVLVREGDSWLIAQVRAYVLIEEPPRTPP